MIGNLDDVLGRMTAIVARVKVHDEALAIELQQEVRTLRRAFLPDSDEAREQHQLDNAAQEPGQRAVDTPAGTRPDRPGQPSP